MTEDRSPAAVVDRSGDKFLAGSALMEVSEQLDAKRDLCTP